MNNICFISFGKKQTKNFTISLMAAFAQTQLKLTVYQFNPSNSDKRVELDVHRVYSLKTNIILFLKI